MLRFEDICCDTMLNISLEVPLASVVSSPIAALKEKFYEESSLYYINAQTSILAAAFPIILFYFLFCSPCLASNTLIKLSSSIFSN